MNIRTISHAPARTAASAGARARTRFAAAAVGALAALGLVLGAASPALAHDELVDTGFQVDNATGEISGVNLVFSNEILDVGTEIVVESPDGDDVVAEAPVVSGRSILQPLPGLETGDYAVAWRVVSSDGHPIEGVFTLSVDGADTQIRAGAPDEAPSAVETDEPATPEGADAGTDIDAAADEAAHDHEHDHDSAEPRESASPVTIAIASAIGGLAVIGAVAMIVIGQRRRTRAMREAAESDDRTDA